MMKGSTNTQATMPQNTGPQNTGGKGFSFDSFGGDNLNKFLGFMNMMMPQYSKAWTSLGYTPPNAAGVAPQPQRQGLSVPAMPAYTNYQQMPIYFSQPAAPSDAIMRFMSGYASGGNVRTDASDNIEDDIKAALRLARLIGELTKKE